MNQNRMQKTQILFREIGAIDDRWLDEALHYRQERRINFSRLILVAACLSLSLMLVLGTVIVAKLGAKDTDGAGNGGIQAPEDVGTAPYRLDTILAGAADEVARGEITVLDDDSQLDFFSGEAHVVWKSADGATLYVSRALTESELNRLTSAMQAPDALPSQAYEQPTCPVWILCGDGTVLSPYLKSSNGNQGAAVLFDYSVEVIPNASFTSCISDILN